MKAWGCLVDQHTTYRGCGELERLPHIANSTEDGKIMDYAQPSPFMSFRSIAGPTHKVHSSFKRRRIVRALGQLISILVHAFLAAEISTRFWVLYMQGGISQ